ncbi:PLP-dependent aminotransferase [Campylobacter blaseri]|uniref:Glutamate decarboxylase n=1 Tax=Campylobacter blaseri TaxID=2042961 RepID=A0A2P8R422_9BACT|nr:aminotransferase class I/II-fold pyridoxal phosphate-dependent enzyme [Campylobacter blaseri]PSM53238.1 glutamate decarboxylase [Campylobacter blaseri]PSM54704.1 glutamate decarboxylase [Campylobacter blaseri]QKF86812.1 PLP-dependent aminotransferase [Campylobacter blaseri]
MNKEEFILFQWKEAQESLNKFMPMMAEEQMNASRTSIINPLPEEKKEKIKSIPFQEEPRSANDVMDDLKELVYKYRTMQNNPRFFSFIPLALSPISVVGEAINAFYSPYGGSHTLSQGMAVAEKRLINWLGEQVGYPVKELGGLFVSGGSMANLTASIVARDEKLKDNEFYKGTVYISDQTHSSVAKGIRVMGIPRANIKKVKTNRYFQMIPEELEKQIQEDKEAGYIPFLIVGSCGTTNTGSIDPLHKLADISEKYNTWLHIDGAYGASALLSSYRELLDGIERSDSISWDGHKWLFQSYGCAVVICKDRQAMARTFNSNPEYLTDIKSDDSNINFWDMGIELTAPARGMRLWYTLQRVGLKEMRRAIDKGFENAKYFEELFKKEAYFEIVSPAQLSTVNIRYFDNNHSEEELNQINKKLSEMATKRNKAIYYTTMLNEKIVLRFCTINPLLTKKDVKEVVEEIKNDIVSLGLIK